MCDAYLFGCNACSLQYRAEPAAFRHNFSWRGFVALWRLVMPAADQKLEISRHL